MKCYICWPGFVAVCSLLSVMMTPNTPNSSLSLAHQSQGLPYTVSPVAGLRTEDMIDCRCHRFFRMETRRSLQTQMMAGACWKIHAIIPVTPGNLPSLSPLRETSGIHAISQCHHFCPKRDSVHDRGHQVNPRPVGSSGTTLPQAYYHCGVSKWKTCSHYGLTPAAQACRNSVPKIHWPIQQGGAPRHPSYGFFRICVACLVETQALAVQARRCSWEG